MVGRGAATASHFRDEDQERFPLELLEGEVDAHRYFIRTSSISEPLSDR